MASLLLYMSDYYEVEQPPHMEKAVLIGLVRNMESEAEEALSLEELHRLSASAGAEVVNKRLVRLRNPHPATLISKGLLEELAMWADLKDAESVILDEDVSPAQQRNLEKAFKKKIITRSALILDIFATHAQTRAAMTQIEIAQLRYMQPRLIGAGIASAKMGGVATSGGIATRGPGETQLEVDRRAIRRRLQMLEKTLERIQKQRATQRARRQKAGLPLVGIAGYTNAGKSTLLNRLTDAGVLAEDRLFATLDTTVRNLTLPGGMEVGLIDTVGFVSKLPPDLVAAFHATLEEIAYADLILHVVDTTSPRLEMEFQTTREIFEELGCQKTPRLTVWNKIDQMEDAMQLADRVATHQPAVAISALKGEGIDELLHALEREILSQGHFVRLLIPYDEYHLVAQIHREGKVLETRDLEEGKYVECRLPESLAQTLQPYRAEEA